MGKARPRFTRRFVSLDVVYVHSQITVDCLYSIMYRYRTCIYKVSAVFCEYMCAAILPNTIHLCFKKYLQLHKTHLLLVSLFNLFKFLDVTYFHMSYSYTRVAYSRRLSVSDTFSLGEIDH